MNPKAKIERAKAIKEELARVTAKHQRLVKLEEAAEPTYLSTLLENDLEQAELILAAQDVMTRLQEMAEDLAKTSARDLFPLADRMKAAFGPVAAKAFEESATHALNNAMEAVRDAKDELGTAILKIEGKIPQNDMGSDEGIPAEPDLAKDGEDDANPFDDSGDEFAGADAASGPEEEPLGRMKKESIEAAKTPLREKAFDYRKAGRALLERESMSELMGWLLAEAAVAMAPEDFGNFAKTVKIKASEDPEATAGWIGKKRYGAAAMAQLAAPTMTSTANFSMALGESQELSEYNRFDDEDDDDDYEGRDGKRRTKHRDLKRDLARTRKYDAKIAEGIATVIEHNIRTLGKGNAASVVSAFANKFGNLVEGKDDFDGQAHIIAVFEELYGMKPAAYSVAKLREFMNTQDEKMAATTMASMATKMAKDKNLANKPISTAMSGLDSNERAAVQKVTQKLKKDGKDPKKVGDLIAGAEEMTEQVSENINAAHWPTSEFGQYKGEPMSTDYGKLKAKSGTPAKESEPKTEDKSAEPKKEPADEVDDSPKADDKQVSKFAKKPKEEKPVAESAPAKLDELSPATLASYAKNAVIDGEEAAMSYNWANDPSRGFGSKEHYEKTKQDAKRRMAKREKGFDTAMSKLVKKADQK